MKERGDVHGNSYAPVRDRLKRHVGVAVDREGGADEEHRVVHLAERHGDPAGDEGGGSEIAGRCDGIAAAASWRAEVVAAARRYVADQGDLVAAVKDQDLIG